MTFWPQWPHMTPDWHLTFDPITYVEGLKLMNLYESYDHAV